MDSVPAEVVLHSSPASLFHYSGGGGNGQFKCVAMVVASITSMGAGEMQQIVCKDHSTGEQHCAGRIGKRNVDSIQYSIQNNSYASFRGNDGEHYSLYFKVAEELQLFTLHYGIALALTNATSHSANKSVTSVDVGPGKGPSAAPGDAIAVRFNAYIASLSPPKLTKQYDNNMSLKHSYKFPIPLTTGAHDLDLKGFEGHTVGMKCQTKRLVVIPASCTRDGILSDDEVLLVYMDATRLKVAATAHSLPAVSSLQIEAAPPPPISGNQMVISDRMHNESFSSDLVSEAPTSSPLQPVVHQIQVVAPQQQTENPMKTFELIENQKKLMNGTELTMQSIASSNTTLLDKMTEMSEKIDDVSVNVKRLQPKSKGITTSQAMSNLQILLDDTGKLQDALLAKEARIRDLETRLQSTLQRADGMAEINAELVSSQKDVRRSETDRLIMRLEDQVTQQSTVSDDTVAKLSSAERKNHILEERCESMKNELIIAKVEAETQRAKATELVDLLNTERLARDRLEERCEKLSSESSHFKETTFQKSQENSTLIMKLETDKQKFLQLLEDGQLKAEQVTDELRDDMLRELQQRDQKFQEERTRVANDSFTRGVDHGREVVASEIRMKWETETRDLRISNGKLTAQLEALKGELTLERAASKTTIDKLCYPTDETEAKEVNTLQAHITVLQKQLSDTFDKVAVSESSLSEASTKLLLSEQKLRDTEIRCTSAVVALSRQVVPKHSLVALLQQVFRGQNPDTSFEAEDEIYTEAEKQDIKDTKDRQLSEHRAEQQRTRDQAARVEQEKQATADTQRRIEEAENAAKAAEGTRQAAEAAAQTAEAAAQTAERLRREEEQSLQKARKLQVENEKKLEEERQQRLLNESQKQEEEEEVKHVVSAPETPVADEPVPEQPPAEEPKPEEKPASEEDQNNEQAEPTNEPSSPCKKSVSFSEIPVENDVMEAAEEAPEPETQKRKSKSKKSKRGQQQQPPPFPHGTAIEVLYDGEWYPAVIAPEDSQQNEDQHSTIVWDADGYVSSL